jgi:hypothetical protein
MDPTAFDTLAHSFSTAGTRRRLLGVLIALLPVAGPVAPLEESAAQGRQHGHNRAHRPGRAKDNRKGKRKGQGKAEGQDDPCLPPTADLQAAIDAAPAGSTLRLCAGTFAAVNLTINKPLHIFGTGLHAPGAKVTILDAQFTGTAITVANNQIGGKEPIYGTLAGLTVKGSKLNVPAIVNAPGSALELASVTVTFNFGTGIRNAGTLRLRSTKVYENTTDQNGAGIFNTKNGMATLDEDCQVFLNRAGGTGGGIYLDSGSVNLARNDMVGNNRPNNCAPPNTIGNCLN